MAAVSESWHCQHLRAYTWLTASSRWHNRHRFPDENTESEGHSQPTPGPQLSAGAFVVGQGLVCGGEGPPELQGSDSSAKVEPQGAPGPGALCPRHRGPQPSSSLWSSSPQPAPHSKTGFELGVFQGGAGRLGGVLTGAESQAGRRGRDAPIRAASVRDGSRDKETAAGWIPGMVSRGMWGQGFQK